MVVVSRMGDNYINATQLCQAGGKKFNHWFSLETTKHLINELNLNTGIPALELVEINVGGNHTGSWIHPDIAIQLAQWISPSFALQVSKWIRNLFTNGSEFLNIKKLEEEIKIKDERIKSLQNICLKKQPRSNYPINVIYLLTSESNKNKRIYIIGKASVLKDRLSGYNKSEEHEVVYYKECPNNDIMKAVETNVLTKLSKHREKLNRDRFILPSDKDINYFIESINDAVNYFN